MATRNYETIIIGDDHYKFIEEFDNEALQERGIGYDDCDKLVIGLKTSAESNSTPIPAQFIVDTGAHKTQIKPELAKSLGLKLSAKTATITLANGSEGKYFESNVFFHIKSSMVISVPCLIPDRSCKNNLFGMHSILPRCLLGATHRKLLIYSRRSKDSGLFLTPASDLRS